MEVDANDIETLSLRSEHRPDSNESPVVVGIQDPAASPPHSVLTVVTTTTGHAEATVAPTPPPLVVGRLQFLQNNNVVPAASGGKPKSPAAIVVQSTFHSGGRFPGKQSPAGRPSPGQGGDRKLAREYHPDRHCGVWKAEGNRNCTRSLTCKSHSVNLKRKVEGRSGPFDELLAAHKKAAMSAVTSQPVVVPVAAPVRAVVPAFTALASPKICPIPLKSVPCAAGLSQQLLPASLLLPQTPVKPQQLLQLRTGEVDQHYTPDHPKPLAVCTFGGRRLGGLMLPDRSKLLTRKLVSAFLVPAWVPTPRY
jgi:hypothetical protein